MLRTLFLSLALSCVAITSPAAAAPASSRPLLIAQPVDLSGPNADFGRDHSLGAKVYFDHVNARGGILGRRIAYRAIDTGGLPSRALGSTRALLGENGPILFGATGNAVIEALAGDPTLRASGIAIFGAIGGQQSASDDGVIHLRASMTDEIHAMLSQLRDLGISTFGLVSSAEQTPEATQAMNSGAARLGIRILRQDRLPTDPAGAGAAADQMARSRPQAVIVIGDTLSAAQFFKRYRSLDPGTFLCTTSLVNVRTLTATIGPQAARGLIVSQVVPAPSSYLELTREHQRLMEKYADEPSSPATLEGFIAARALVQALQKAPEGTAKALRQALATEGRMTLGGYTLDFTKGGRASRFVELSVINSAGRLLR